LSKSKKPPVTCKLCHKTAHLCRSHIIPDFAYRPIYDETHRLVEVSVFGKDRELQSGRWEYMLCSECEQRFSRWESYFARAWKMADNQPTTVNRNTTLRLSRLDYTQFKLFHLSILWRLGASTLAEYKAVKLGPHQDRIGKMLLADNPGPPNDYPFWAHLLFHEGRVSTDIIVGPRATKLNAVNVYIVVFGGCAWYYCVSSHDPGSLAPERCRFSANGELFLTARDAYSYPSIKRIIKGYLANAQFDDGLSEQSDSTAT
jgi:hypothetical protein